MTRINLIDPGTLHSKHLVAEYRELPRVFKLVEAAEKRGATVTIPPEYVLGPGHVTFFYNKLGFLAKRFELLVKECQKRGFNITYTTVPVVDAKLCWWGDYVPTAKAIALNEARIKDRMPK
jgi:deoxyribonuclease (pyrimidine dimer)